MMGFKPTLVELIMQCVPNASFSIIINGNLTGHIVPSRGLREFTLSLSIFALNERVSQFFVHV